jgi:hypothetical protein
MRCYTQRVCEALEPTIGLMVPVPAADALVRTAQARFQPNSPAAHLLTDLTAAHVTVLWPFLPPDRIDHQVLGELRAICAIYPRHAFMLERVAVFPGGGVYLPTEPSNVFVELTRAVWKRWPEYPPYRGMYAEIIPHVTVAVIKTDSEVIQQAIRFAESFLPIRAEADELQVILVHENTWTLLHRMPLGNASAPV